MNLRRMPHPFTAGVAKPLLALAAAALFAAGCASERRASDSPAGAPGTNVTGTLVALQDNRAADGGFDLTLETASGTRELVRVPSLFMVPPRDSVRAMHEVAEAAKLGDRLRAHGTRDGEGALRAEFLEAMPR